MATRIARVDDLTGETIYGGDPVRFEFDGDEYEIDLSPGNHSRLRAAFAPYIEAATKAQRAHYRTTQLPRVEPKKTR